ncbi:hypothetical protein I5677_04090 [Mobilitalea sibirica]|uniref:Uncharacterized protein n=1 Tax=Mobilitalea sibirica TaxID=1462919 RepID=A0A8J7KVE7_9FIRM|nr:hypothetical protein [Mobilitalea sibirica]MBH1940075.1 hypothetical protein [Mobilitalea sibirica]
MSIKYDNTVIALEGSDYVPVLMNENVYFGGSQMWFPANHKFGTDYILHHYGCGTIACADLFLYLALQDDSQRTLLTEIALQGIDSVYYIDYMSYVRKVNDLYTKTKRWLAVLGTKLAAAINDYSEAYHIGYYAKWKLGLSYYDMYEIMEEMLDHNIPVILSIGPNTPKLWGKNGISFYQQYKKIILLESSDFQPDVNKKDTNVTESSEEIYYEPITVYAYKEVKKDINSHYVTVTGIIKDEIDSTIMLCISSWGKKYYINYEEYRNYIEENSGTYTSSLVYIK